MSQSTTTVFPLQTTSKPLPTISPTTFGSLVIFVPSPPSSDDLAEIDFILIGSIIGGVVCCLLLVLLVVVLVALRNRRRRNSPPPSNGDILMQPTPIMDNMLSARDLSFVSSGRSVPVTPRDNSYKGMSPRAVVYDQSLPKDGEVIFY
jgi:hypothetical protein